MQANRFFLIVNTRRLPALLLLLVLLVSLAACSGSTGSTRLSQGTSTSAPSLTYVAIGASDAYGVGTNDPDRESWPTVLASLFTPQMHLINLGIPGETVALAQKMELPIALDSKANIITVWLAVNDFADGVSLAEYSLQLRRLLQALRQGTQAYIFVGNLPDLTLLPHFASYDPATLEAEVQQWNAAIAAICNETRVTLVDIYSGWNQLATHPEYISSDGFHPSTEGARQLALFFQTVIIASGGVS